MGDEIKTWKVRSVKHKVAMVLIIDGVSFSYNVDDGIVFSGTVFTTSYYSIFCE